MTQAALDRKAELEKALGRIVKNLVDRYEPKCVILRRRLTDALAGLKSQGTPRARERLPAVFTG